MALCSWITSTENRRPKRLDKQRLWCVGGASWWDYWFSFPWAPVMVKSRTLPSNWRPEESSWKKQKEVARVVDIWVVTIEWLDPESKIRDFWRAEIKVPERKISKARRFILVHGSGGFSVLAVAPVLRQSNMVGICGGGKEMGREQGQDTCQALLSVTCVLFKSYFLRVP